MLHSTESSQVIGSLIGNLRRFHNTGSAYENPDLALFEAFAVPICLAGLPQLRSVKLYCEGMQQEGPIDGTRVLGVFGAGEIQVAWDTNFLEFLNTSAHEFRHHEQCQLMAIYDPQSPALRHQDDQFIRTLFTSPRFNQGLNEAEKKLSVGLISEEDRLTTATTRNSAVARALNAIETNTYVTIWPWLERVFSHKPDEFNRLRSAKEEEQKAILSAEFKTQLATTGKQIWNSVRETDARQYAERVTEEAKKIDVLTRRLFGSS